MLLIASMIANMETGSSSGGDYRYLCIGSKANEFGVKIGPLLGSGRWIK